MAKCKEHPLNVPINEEHITDNMRVHGLLICIAVLSSIMACSLSGYLIFRHATHYTQPKRQKQIMRILLMVPIYTISCTLCIPFYKKNVYIASIYEFYESLVIASFFLLLCQYLHLDLESLRRVFALVEPKPWIHPIRFIVVHLGRNKKGQTEDGLKWFNIIWVGVFQFCVIKFLGALTKCITEAADVYCEESSNVSHAKIWVMVIEILSLITAMLCLLQFYTQTKLELAPHRPLLKFVAIKLVVFLFYVQTFIFNMLTKSGGAIKPSAKFSYPSWAVGVPNTLLCVEMAAISVLHLWAYPYDVYKPPIASDKSTTNPSSQEDHDRMNQPLEINSHRDLSYELQTPGHTSTHGLIQPAQPSALISYGGFLGWHAFVDMLNFIDLFQSVVGGFHWLFVQRRRNKTAQELNQTQNAYHNGTEHTGRPKTTRLSEALTAIRQSQA